MEDDDLLLELDFDHHQTLGFLAADWIERHCVAPGGVFEGKRFTLVGWQLEVIANHYRIRPDAIVDPIRVVAPFHYRKSLVIGPQKTGKSPLGAGVVLFDAVGPAIFDGWAEPGDVYECRDGGCPCGWVYEYEPGEAKGRIRGKSLVQILAYNEKQTKNVFDQLHSMVAGGPLTALVKLNGDFMWLPKRGRIETVTAAAKGKIGNPITFAMADESGLYTETNRIADTWDNMQRGYTGMQGRGMELTNPPDPMDNSAAQQELEAEDPEVYTYYKPPPSDLDYANAKDRARIHELNYKSSPWVDPKHIDGLANAMVRRGKLAQAARFFGNLMVQGDGAYLTVESWDEQTVPEDVPDKAWICLGFDGSRSSDWSAIRAETENGYRFTPTYGPDQRPCVWNPDEWGGRIPRGEVNAAVDELFRKYDVRRFYGDPRHWETQLDQWAEQHGADRIVQWQTGKIPNMFDALIRYQEDLLGGLTTHSDDHTMRLHALAARRVAKPGDKWILGKPSDHQKIDMLMSDILAHEAAADVRAKGSTGGRLVNLKRDDDNLDGYDFRRPQRTMKPWEAMWR